MWRTAITRRRTRYQGCPHPALNVCSRTSGTSPASSSQPSSRRTLHSSKPGSCVPTRAVWRYTSRGSPQASGDMSYRSSPERILICRSLMPRWLVLPSRPSLRTTAVLPSALRLCRNGRGYQRCGCAEQFLREGPFPLSPRPWLFSPRSGPCRSTCPEH